MPGYKNRPTARAARFAMASGTDMPFSWKKPKQRSAPVAAVVVARKKRKKSYGQGGPEMKFVDVVTAWAYHSTANVVQICNVAQGLTNITRIGNKIQIKSVEMKIRNILSGTATHLPNQLRVALVLDKEPEAAAVASYNQIYTDNTVHAFRNIGESDRFVVLAVEEFTSPFANTTGAGFYGVTGDPMVNITRFVNCDIAMKYSGTAATQASTATNQLLVCMIADSIDANADLIVSTRVRFTDE